MSSPAGPWGSVGVPAASTPCAWLRHPEAVGRAGDGAELTTFDFAGEGG